MQHATGTSTAAAGAISRASIAVRGRGTLRASQYISASATTRPHTAASYGRELASSASPIASVTALGAIDRRGFFPRCVTSRASPPSSSAPPSRPIVPPQYWWPQITICGCTAEISPPKSAHEGGRNARRHQVIAATANIVTIVTPTHGARNATCPSASTNPCAGPNFDMYVGVISSCIVSKLTQQSGVGFVTRP
jgi:hypothetical protein